MGYLGQTCRVFSPPSPLFCSAVYNLLKKNIIMQTNKAFDSTAANATSAIAWAVYRAGGPSLGEKPSSKYSGSSSVSFLTKNEKLLENTRE